MKPSRILCALLAVLLLLIPMQRKDEETVNFHGRTFRTADLSEETLEWLQWYNALTGEEQLAVSYIPHDLHTLAGYAGKPDAPAG